VRPLAIWLIVTAVLALWALAWAPAAMRRRRVDTTEVIDRDQRAVFELVSDLRNFPSFWPGVESAEKVTHGPVGIGTQFQMQLRVGKLIFLDKDEILEYTPPIAVSWRIDGYSPSTERLTIEADAQATRVLHRSESVETYLNALFGLAMLAPILNWARRRDHRVALLRLKQLLETGATT